jgi:uncharacterized SAM-dependent methyltransferase
MRGKYKDNFPTLGTAMDSEYPGKTHNFKRNILEVLGKNQRANIELKNARKKAEFEEAAQR